MKVRTKYFNASEKRKFVSKLFIHVYCAMYWEKKLIMYIVEFKIVKDCKFGARY